MKAVFLISILFISSFFSGCMLFTDKEEEYTIFDLQISSGSNQSDDFYFVLPSPRIDGISEFIDMNSELEETQINGESYIRVQVPSGHLNLSTRIELAYFHPAEVYDLEFNQTLKTSQHNQTNSTRGYRLALPIFVDQFNGSSEGIFFSFRVSGLDGVVNKECPPYILEGVVYEENYFAPHKPTQTYCVNIFTDN